MANPFPLMKKSHSNKKVVTYMNKTNLNLTATSVPYTLSLYFKTDNDGYAAFSLLDCRRVISAELLAKLIEYHKLVVKEMFKAESVFVISKREYDENADWSS